jgi:hypothetical protein
MAKPSLFDTEPDDEAVPDVPRLRKVPGKVTDDGLEYIQDAISLKRATLASAMPRLSDGVALTLICRDWLITESARLSGKGQP